LNSLIRPTHPVTHDTKAVADGWCTGFRTIADYARGGKAMMSALSQLFQRLLSQDVHVPAASICAEERHLPGWRRAPAFEIGD
jgi:hypothetical protein